MKNRPSIVDGKPPSFKSKFTDQDLWKDTPVESSQIKERIHDHIRNLFSLLEKDRDNRSFDEVEKGLIPMVFTLGRLFLAYFLAWREENSEKNIESFRRRGFQEKRPQPRFLGTFFGKVRYWRTYLKRGNKSSGGTYALDLALGLTADGFSMLVMSLAARLATLNSFDQVTGLLMTFLYWSPAKMSVEKAVLGLGGYTAKWFAEAPPPEGDGGVLVIQIDSKATPTARDQELTKRRGKRRPNPYPKSPRHRGRVKRLRRGKKARRKKGDKSKNGKAATLVVMYTLKRTTDRNGRAFLLGPINRKVYASYAPKRHAFAIARREADKRGFTEESGKLIQILTDGDEDLEQYAREFFPTALHTLDVMHVLERVWQAGECLYKEGSPELIRWVEGMKNLVYAGRIKKLLRDLGGSLRSIPKTGPGNKGKRKRLQDVVTYLSKRVHLMKYRWLISQDMEISTGSVEGAVKHVVAKRFDNGSMRWIKERSEALLQLRCIEINGDWDAFIAFVQRELSNKSKQDFKMQTLLKWEAAALPTFGIAA